MTSPDGGFEAEQEPQTGPKIVAEQLDVHDTDPYESAPGCHGDDLGAGLAEWCQLRADRRLGEAHTVELARRSNHRVDVERVGEWTSNG